MPVTCGNIQSCSFIFVPWLHGCLVACLPICLANYFAYSFHEISNLFDVSYACSCPWTCTCNSLPPWQSKLAPTDPVCVSSQTFAQSPVWIKKLCAFPSSLLFAISCCALDFIALQIHVPNVSFSLSAILDVPRTSTLFVTDLSVPEIVDFRDNVTLSCSYDMSGHTLNSVKWYKDRLEFFRYI